MAVIALLANGAVQQLIQPLAFGAALGIHPLAVLVVTISGGALFGTIGLILAAPLASAAVHISADVAAARAREAASASDDGDSDAAAASAAAVDPSANGP
jgi:predicted PurR-regulated permease PerM